MFNKKCTEQNRYAYFSSQANGSLCEVLSLPLKVPLLLLEKPPLLFESLLLLQRVAVVEESCCLIIKGWVQLLLDRINSTGAGVRTRAHFSNPCWSGFHKRTCRSCCCAWMNSLHCCTSRLISSISSSCVSLGITSLLTSSWFCTWEACQANNS